jgi:hypothetical protein
MTERHFDKVLTAFLDRKPFKPFTVELVGGERFEIDHPRATVVRNGIAIFLRPGGTPVYFDHDNVLQFIDRIGENGAGKTRRRREG